MTDVKQSKLMPEKVLKRAKSKILFKAEPKFSAEIAVRKLSKQDPVLGGLIKKVGKYGLQLESIESPFHALAESIVYQQLSGKAASTIFARVCALFDSPQYLCPHEIAASNDELLRSAGLSRNKLASIKDLANKAIEGIVPGPEQLREMSDEEIIESLTKIRGIGKWTVEMMLMFRLGRMDVLPIDDYGIRKGFAITFALDELPKPKELAEHGQRWRPYRTIASWYLWRSLDLNK